MENQMKSPARQSLFRTCKSPLRNSTGSTVKRSLVSNIEKSMEKKDGKRVRRKYHTEKDDIRSAAKDVIENFPELHANFEITRKIGEGTFSKVYLAKFRENPAKVIAIKHLVPTSSPGRIENELKCLQFLGGSHNILKIESAMRKQDHIIFIMDYFPHKKFSEYVRHMTVDNIRDYMRNLFVALKHVHSRKIIHRDVKPNNFLYSKELNRYTLIDFGLAMPVPGVENTIIKDYSSPTVLRSMHLLMEAQRTNRKPKADCKHSEKDICTICKSRPRQCAPRAGTPGFRSPEVLMRHNFQTTAVDMWSAGVILLCILSGRYPFFKAKDDGDALAQITRLFGSKKIKEMGDSIGKNFICSPPLDREDDLRTLCEKLAKPRSCVVHNPKNTDTSRASRKNSERKRESGGEEYVSGSELPTHKKDSVSNLGKTAVTTELLSAQANDDGNHETLGEDSGTEDSVSNLKPEIFEWEKCEGCIVKDSCRTHRREHRIRTGVRCNCLPDDVYDLLERLLDVDPHKRLTAHNALQHPFIFLK